METSKEFEKLPSEIKKEATTSINIHKSRKIDWYGIEKNFEKLVEETNKKSDENEEINDNEPTTKIALVKNVVDNMISIFSSDKDIQELNFSENGLFKIKNIKIKDGVIYAKNIQDIMEAGIKPQKNNLWVVIPHIKDISKDYSVEVPLKYIKHNGLWWYVLPDNTVLEDIEFELFDTSTLKDNKNLLK